MKQIIEIARQAKKLSKSNLVKVGCGIQDTKGNIEYGYNGHGFIGGDLEDDNGMTKPGVIHAEADAIARAAKRGMKLEGATMVVTTAPCMNCAALICSSGITTVCYIDKWWDIACIELMLMHNIRVARLKKRTPDTSPSHEGAPVS
jgi:dCMP deaminase